MLILNIFIKSKQKLCPIWQLIGDLNTSAFPLTWQPLPGWTSEHEPVTSSRQWHCFNAASLQLYDFPLFHLLWEPLSPQRWDIILKFLHGGAMKMSVRYYKGRKFYGAHNLARCCYFTKVWLLPCSRISRHSSDLLPLISCFRHLCSQSGSTWTPTFL